MLQTVTDLETVLPLPNQILKLYYAGTAVFLVLDYVFKVNVRVAFLDAWPAWRLVYYCVCFGLLAAIIWRPAWAEVLGVVESTVTLSALILTMAVRVMFVTDDMIETGSRFVTTQELINFIVSGGIAWLSWQRGMLALTGKSSIHTKR
ncbi:MAG: hypothetical protein QNJ05_03195 [Woeseiaceae bacterium]|nr:hypothetical protein [Woeseiaceae bacterium]